MRQMKRLPDAELAVMQIVWRAGTAVTSAEVMAAADRDWKATSVLTFLSRLCDKGFLKSEKQGKVNYYTAQVAEKDYLEQESAGFLERLYHGSIKNLVASLTDAGALTETDLEELRAFLDRQEG